MHNQRHSRTYKTRRITERKFSASEYVTESGKNPERVSGAKFVPPRFGSKGYGHFEVKLDTPHYEVDLERA